MAILVVSGRLYALRNAARSVPRWMSLRREFQPSSKSAEYPCFRPLSQNEPNVSAVNSGQLAPEEFVFARRPDTYIVYREERQRFWRAYSLGCFNDVSLIHTFNRAGHPDVFSTLRAGRNPVNSENARMLGI